MKRIIALILTLVLLTGISLSAAEETNASPDFFQSLMNWAQNLNLDESDYTGSVRWGNNPVYSGTLRKNREITEIELTGLGKAQISGQKVMLEIGGIKLGTELFQLMKWARFIFPGERTFLRALWILWPWLQKVFNDVILPSVRIQYSDEGLTVYFDVSRFDPLGILQDRDYHLTVIPGAITFTGRTGTYELRIAENTADRLVIRLTRDGRDELGSLVLELDEERAFSGLLTVMGKETGSVMIRPVPKEPIDVITEEQALMISPGTLLSLIGIGR